jgi:hypothetical protein
MHTCLFRQVRLSATGAGIASFFKFPTALDCRPHAKSPGGSLLTSDGPAPFKLHAAQVHALMKHKKNTLLRIRLAHNETVLELSFTATALIFLIAFRVSLDEKTPGKLPDVADLFGKYVVQWTSEHVADFVIVACTLPRSPHWPPDLIRNVHLPPHSSTSATDPIVIVCIRHQLTIMCSLFDLAWSRAPVGLTVKVRQPVIATAHKLYRGWTLVMYAFTVFGNGYLISNVLPYTCVPCVPEASRPALARYQPPARIAAGLGCLFS